MVHKGQTCEAEKTIRSVVDACADCDSCRFLMDKSCLLFPELYRLYDQEKDNRKSAASHELLRLPDLCTLCGLCPCPNIRNDVIRSKTQRAGKEGMPLSVRLLADVQRFATWSGLFPRLVNMVLTFKPIAGILKKNFHEASLRLGKTLMEKIRAAHPEAIVTDCLSCRLQFLHALPYPVLHPLELISRAYKADHV